MTLRQIGFLCVLTLCYLVFELAFNARLLDVVGSAADESQVHHIEVFGRSLSGIAAALVVLQVLLARRNRRGSPAILGILFWCLVTGVVIYGALYELVERLATTSSPEFRRQSLNIQLLQRALVDGSAEVDGLGTDPGLLAEPQGKAFLALFPALAVSVERLDEKIAAAKQSLIERALDRQMGGPQGYAGSWDSALKATREQWQKYRRIPQDLDARVAREQDRAWSDYVADLRKRRWTPGSVPGYAHASVLRSVRNRVPVPADWALDDEAGFREAVAARVRRQAGVGAGDGSVAVHGQHVPPGLGFEDFVRQRGVQLELQDKLKAPDDVPIAATYADGAAFERLLYRPMLHRLAAQKLRDYESPVADFADGHRLQETGVAAVRAVIVPPIALFFSLLGAIGHASKLSYLVVKGAHVPISKRFAGSLADRLTGRAGWVPVGALAIAFAALALLENDVTRSRLYAYMSAQTTAGHGDGGQHLAALALMGALHDIAVGQGYAYPFDEKIRTDLLGGITFGYQPPSAGTR